MSDDTRTTNEYVWVTNGGCERCDALDGLVFDTEPFRPHRNCNCSIISRSGVHRDCRAEFATYEVAYSSPVHHTDGSNENDEFDLVFDYRIRCWDGEIIEGQVSVSLTYAEMWATGDPEDAMLSAEMEAYELVEEIAATECHPCTPPLVS